MPDPFDRRFRNKKVVFLDLDGTVYMGDALLPGAQEFLGYLRGRGIRAYFLSNNSSRSKTDYAARLTRLGIPTTEEDILLSTDGLIAFLKDRGATDIYAVGTRSMLEMMRHEGLQVDAPEPAFVVLGFDTELTYAKLRKAALFLQRGIELLATHPDLVCPTPEGPIPDVGAMLALFEKATGKRPRLIFGKPNAEMVSHILDRHGASPAEAVMIGDRIYTDMELARRVGCDSILVLSGEARREDLQGLPWEPSLVVENLGAILEA
jgi:HAD superfamily hydrolase (TIGR01450 family)